MKRSCLQGAVDFSSNLLVTGRAPKIAPRLEISGSKVTLSSADLPQRFAASILYQRCISTSLPWKLHNTYGKSTKQTNKMHFDFCIYFYSNYPSASFLFIAKDLNKQLKGRYMMHAPPWPIIPSCAFCWKLCWFKPRHQLRQVPFVHVPFLEVLRSSQSSPDRLIESRRISLTQKTWQQNAADCRMLIYDTTRYTLIQVNTRSAFKRLANGSELTKDSLRLKTKSIQSHLTFENPKTPLL